MKKTSYLAIGSMTCQSRSKQSKMLMTSCGGFMHSKLNAKPSKKPLGTESSKNDTNRQCKKFNPDTLLYYLGSNSPVSAPETRLG